jgi:hypothetical protein
MSVPLPLSSIVELPPELAGGITFHLPLEVIALEAAGASSEVVRERILAGLSEAYRLGLVDPPQYRWAVDLYQPIASELLSRDTDERAAALEAVAPLAEGLAGAAFHGLIRLGYGVMRRDPAEMARGLAYLRSRRQVLKSELNRLDHVRLKRKGHPLTALPPWADMTELTVFDQLTLASGASPDVDGGRSRYLPGPKRLVQEAAELVRHDAGSFVAVHIMTGLHGLVELHSLVAGEPPGETNECEVLDPWWRSYAVALDASRLILNQLPFVGRTDCAPNITGAAELVRAAIDSGDAHSLKLVVAMGRLVQFGLLEESEMVELGEIKLGVEECQA